ncbi:bifunctional folylpolyglutamate synthase/dihydrofolate synthase [Prochlorococcus marinus]|uniref:Dihydrofolate synthase n=1 Tax=Prochlorococcus marinus XMU1408 TaxID=2213228 RepID=A0A318R134_PROMR|nr:cyanophycin synthetase [Prochlorococcus marinus]MBW3042482.1 dihydrofolate synthase [Prochlorococcus marinus str. XMU1408]PYE01213.1 dihydrofolate synthase [Prochlorococcus marinus XMU1408]
MSNETFIKKSNFTFESKNTEYKDMNLGIDRMSQAISAMGDPCKKIPAIHIAGTNGKGSIAAFINSVLSIVDIKTGVTTSPHLVDWVERICINKTPISKKEFKSLSLALSPILTKYDLTPFESIVAIALKYFTLKEVKLLILEVGLGGRLDATTAHKHRPIIAFGAIGLDHCEYLGKSLKKIAIEKAAVITPKSTVITAAQHNIVKQVFKETAIKQQAKIHWVDPLPSDWELGLSGIIQKENAAVAKGVIESLENIGWKISQEQIKEGLSVAKWPGRLQYIKWKGMPIIVDGAHNPHAAKQLSIERETWSDQESGITWILGIQKQKDMINILHNLIREKDIAWIVPVPGQQSWSTDQILSFCPEYKSQLKEALSAEAVLSIIRKRKKWPSPPPIITGSLYLIGDLFQRQALKNQVV